MNTEMLAACWTSAGSAGPSLAQVKSSVPLRERIESAAKAGWTGMGFSNVDLDEGRDELGWRGLRQLLQDNGIKNVELEFLDGWWSRSTPGAEPDPRHALLLEAAESLCANNIKISADLTDSDLPFELYVTELAVLARQAGDAGTRLALEPMPMARFRTAADGMKLVNAVDSPYAGLCIDIWHVARSGTSMARLAHDLSIDRVFTVELSDAGREVQGTLWDDTIHRRRYCGEGELDVRGFIDAMRSLGFRGYWGVEILSDAHRALPIAEGLRRAAQTTQAVLLSATAAPA